MKKIVISLITISSLVFALQPTTSTNNSKQNMMQKKKKNAPFLIMGKMPHLTKKVMMNWDELELNDNQKEKLTKIRKETMGTIGKVKPQIATLEDEVAKATLNGAKPETLKTKVDQIAKLKAQATMAHINCIYETKNTLTEEQLELIQ